MFVVILLFSIVWLLSVLVVYLLMFGVCECSCAFTNYEFWCLIWFVCFEFVGFWLLAVVFCLVGKGCDCLLVVL